MKSWILKKPYELELIEIPKPVPKKDEVLVRMRYIGLCGSDIEIYRGKRDPEFLANPVRLGHEASGVVEEVGPEVQGLKTGNKVAVRGIWGCFSEYISASQVSAFSVSSMPALQIVKLPDTFPEAIGPFVEVLPKIIRTGEKIGITQQTDVVIVGQGVCGLLLTQVVKMQNPHRLVTLDLYDEKLGLSKDYGATDTLNASSENLNDLVRSVLPDGADIIIVAHLEGEGVAEAIEFLKWNGKLILWGCLGKTEIDFFRLHIRGGDILGTRMADLEEDIYYCQKTIKYLEDGIIDVKKMITHQFKFDVTPEAFELKDKGKGDVIAVEVISTDGKKVYP